MIDEGADAPDLTGAVRGSELIQQLPRTALDMFRAIRVKVSQHPLIVKLQNIPKFIQYCLEFTLIIRKYKVNFKKIRLTKVT